MGVWCVLPLLTVSLVMVVQARYLDPRCQPMRVPWCSGVYEAVIFPNFLGHQTQEEAFYAMHKLWPLIQLKCSPQILHYLCRLYVPQCPFVPDERSPSYTSYRPELYRPPCEDACLRVRHDCHETLWRYQVHWPKELECHNLRQSQGSCVETPPAHEAPTEPPLPPAPQPPPPETPAPEPQPEPEPETTTEEPVTEEVTEPVTTTEESSEAPSAEETTTAAAESEEAATITAAGEDGLVEPTEATTPEETTPAEEETTPEETTVAAAEEPEPTTPEAEETTPEAVTEATEDEDGTPAPEPVPIGPDATTGSLLGITPVIEEGAVTPDALPPTSDGGSGEVEASTAAAESDPEAANVPDAGADDSESATEAPEAEEASTPIPDGEEESTVADVTEGHHENDAGVPGATGDQDGTTAAPAPANGDDGQEPPRSDRAISSGNKASTIEVGGGRWSRMLIIYLVTVSLIFHRGA